MGSEGFRYLYTYSIFRECGLQRAIHSLGSYHIICSRHLKEVNNHFHLTPMVKATLKASHTNTSAERSHGHLTFYMQSIRRVVSVIYQAPSALQPEAAAVLQSNQVALCPQATFPPLGIYVHRRICERSRIILLFTEKIFIYNILRISFSPKYFSRPESRWSHHSYSMLSQMSLNHGVNLSDGSLNMVLRSSWLT